MAGLIWALLAAAALGGADVKAGVDAWQRGDHAAAVATWSPLAERGDAHAQFNLAQAYKLGRGVPQDMDRAVQLYRRAAAQGHAEAGTLLGLILFQNGRRAEAMPHLIRAAKAGEAGAQYVYGTALFNGDVVKQDLPLAYAMVTRAAAQGLPAAVATVAEMDKHIPLADRQRAVAMPRGQTRTAAVAPARRPVLARPAPEAITSTGGWRVQLGAFGRPANATALFDRLKERLPALRRAQPYLVRTGAVSRLQAGPFASRAVAEDACRAVKASGQACFAVAP